MKRLFRILIGLLATLSAALLLYLGVAYVYNRYFVEYEYRMVGWPAQEDFGPPVRWNPDDPSRVRILAIEGGGLLGLADLEVLKAIEERSGKQIYELFDFVSGTSTGAIIATLLLYPDEKTGKPPTAAEVAKEYEALGGKILSAPLHHRILTADGFLGPRMLNHARILASEQAFSKGTFRDLLRPAMYPSFSQREAGLKMFHNWHPDQANLYLAPLVSAVTSAPTYFPAVLLTGNDQDDDFFSDAGLMLNSPGDIAYLHARSNVPDADEFIVVSLGTHWDFSVSDYTSVRGGIVQWVSPLLAMIFRGEASISRLSLERHRLFQSDVNVVSYQLAPLVPTYVDGFSADKVQTDIILEAGERAVRDQSKQIDEIIQLLTGKGSKHPKRSGKN